jgi:Rad3-related DNA helicase
MTFTPMLCAQMPTGTGKTITLLSLITSYQLAHPEVSRHDKQHQHTLASSTMRLSCV